MPLVFNGGKNVLYINNNKGTNDLVYKVSLAWVLVYTIWNACFSYSNRKEHFALIVVVLLTALLSDIPYSTSIIPALYIQSRTYTLFMRYTIFTIDDVYQKFADSTNWYDEDIAKFWEIINLVIIILVTIKIFFIGN